MEIKQKVATKDADKTISIVLHFSLKCLYQATKVRCHVLGVSILPLSWILELLIQCGIFCILFYSNVLCCCLCVCLALRNNSETLYLCCILYKLHICVLLRVVCQSWFVSTGYWIGGTLSMGLSGYNTYSLTMNYSGQGRIHGGGPLKLEKIWFFGVKSWFFTRNTPKIFLAQLEKI